MRNRNAALLMLVALLILVPLGMRAQAELRLELSMESVPQESVLDFTVQGDSSAGYRYTMLREGEELFSSEVEYTFGSYLPRQTGRYTLKVESLEEGSTDETTADFTVVGKLTLRCDQLPGTVQVGGAVDGCWQTEGGTPPYEYVFAVTDAQGKTVTAQEGDSFYWAPLTSGEYVLHGAVTDHQGARATFRQFLSVEDNQGMGLVHNGGSLCAHGGQESWMVCSNEPWSASSDADFIRIETPSGQPGESLVVTALSPAKQYRKGTITITSGDEQLQWPVSQSAQHGVDEEVFLDDGETEPLYVDGKQHAAWMDAEGSKTFALSPADASWTAETDASFIRAEIADGQLHVTVEKSGSAAVRSGVVMLSTGESCAYLHVYQMPGKTESATEPPPVMEWDSMEIYSQFSGQWKEIKYGHSTLEHSGCAIFALSHALQYLGFEGEEIHPATLAPQYSFTVRNGGTVNSTLVGNAGNQFGFRTRFELYTDQREIRSRLEKGAVFSFAVVPGHIAMVAEASEDGTMMRIIDSAPSATWERIKNAQLYRQTEDGTFVPITSLTELEDIRFFVENKVFGGTTYWLETKYVSRRGVRLIQLREKEE